MKEVIEEIIQDIEWPYKYPDLYKSTGIIPPKGILLYGPPGTGKTMIAKAVATTSEANFISIKGPELLSKWVGESEKGVREVFRKARQASPCIVFFDELDSVAPRRAGGDGGDSHVMQRIVSQLLTEMDGLEDLKGVMVIGATNRPDIIDEALLRPGRFDRILAIPVPDASARKEILNIHTKKKPLDASVNLDKLVELTEGYTGADLAAIVNTAAMSAIKEHITNIKREDEETKRNQDKKQQEKAILTIGMKDFEAALKKVKKKNTKALSNPDVVYA